MFLDIIDFNENYVRRYIIFVRIIGRVMFFRILMFILRIDCRFFIFLLTSVVVIVFRVDRIIGRVEEVFLVVFFNFFALFVFFWCLVFLILRINNLLKYLKICKY